MIDLIQIATLVSATLNRDQESIKIVRPLSIDDEQFDNESIGWCSDKNIELLRSISGNVIISNKAISLLDFDISHLNLLVVENPRKAFSNVLEEFFAKKIEFGNIDSSAIIHNSVIYDPSQVSIGANVVIEEGCTLGNYVTIGHNTVIKSDTALENRVSIGSNCTIGGVGFGYESNDEGEYELIPHVGNVRLDSHVEVGNNVCIDRAVMGSTHLKAHVKVDNLVHIAHGVQIDKNSLVIAHAMIAGSVKIGKNVWVAPSSAILQKLNIGDDSLIGLGSVVTKNVNKGEIVVGVPAKPINKK